MRCTTCHVILEEGVYWALLEPDVTEEDALDMASCLTETSRLGCQVRLDSEIGEITATLPDEVVNCLQAD